MTQRVSQKPVVVLNKGLNTEAGELTFPEGASVDELNFQLERDGSRRRRLGLKFESGFQEFGTDLDSSTITSVNTWENAGGVAGLNILCVQLGNILHFFKETSSTLSGSKYSTTINLTSFARPSGFGASTVPIQTASIEGQLVVASSELNTFRVTFDDDTEVFDVTEIEFKVRDFDFQGKTLSYFEKEGTPSPERIYDTQNAGWTTIPLDAYIAAEGGYPPLTLPWYSGKDASGNFSVSEWNKVFSGTSLIANGTNILDLYRKERDGLEDEVETTRFKTVATFAGRMFYAGMSNKNTNKIFFSQLVYQTERLGDCHSVNDPTSEELSDLLDTDGGVIVIPEAYNIQRLHVLGPYLMVLAENGVWSINGVDNVFKATGYAVDRVSEIGIIGAQSYVSAEGRPYWWSDVGIHTVSVTEQGLLERNLSLNTVQTFWGDISGDSRVDVQAAFDKFNKRVFWFYGQGTEGRNQALIFDEALAAFYPWTLGTSTTGRKALIPFFVSANKTDGVVFNVVDSSGNQVVDSSGNNVVVTKDSRTFSVSQISVLVQTENNTATFAEFSDTEFKDWTETSFSSYVETPYDFRGDMTRKKRIVYLNTVCKVTEEGFSETDEGSFEYIRPSSCLVAPYWDFVRTTGVSLQEAYRIKEIPIVEDPTLVPPNTVTSSKLRLRGRGNSVKLRFESSEGKDLHLLGFDLIMGGNPR